MLFVLDKTVPSETPQWVIDWVASRDWFIELDSYLQNKKGVRIEYAKDRTIINAARELGIEYITAVNGKIVVNIPDEEATLFILQQNQ